MSKFSVIVLAAGKGTRMQTRFPKVLHPTAGIPMLTRVIAAAKQAGAAEVRVVIGKSSSQIKELIESMGATTFVQDEAHGTANAVGSAGLNSLYGEVVIVNGDHPLVFSEDIQGFVNSFREQRSDLSLVVSRLSEPQSYGRIVRDSSGRLFSVVESKDAGPSTLAINEVNTGIYLTTAKLLKKYIFQVRNNNAKKEYYLTDLIELYRHAGLKLSTIEAKARIAFGVNTQSELAVATRLLFRRKSVQLMSDGVVLVDPHATYIEDTVSVGEGSVLFPNVYLRGKTRLGQRCVIEPQCWISDCDIEEQVHVLMGSHLVGSRLGQDVRVGPYARLRPGTELAEGVHIGNFVETKNAKISAHSKASHLTYLGDVEIGSHTNIGCGTITCNYAIDKKKYLTKIGSHVFVGSDTQFVAPVEIGDYAVIGSGSTITKHVPAHALAVARGHQIVKPGYNKEGALSTSSKEAGHLCVE